MKVSDLGEFGLIELLAGIVARSSSGQSPELLVGIGDDAAAWRGDPSIQLATTDTLVQDVHFTLKATSWKELGWKALAVNLSDIAAMGGVPRYALASLSLPGDSEVESIADLYHGMVEIAEEFSMAIVGGNITRSTQMVITMTVLGCAPGDAILTRSAARPGHRVAATGHLGLAAAGLRMLAQGLDFDPETTALLREAQLRPWPRVAEGQLLLRHGVPAAIDISDGLLADLGHLCRASGVAAQVRIDQVSIHPRLRAVFGDGSLGLALSGGEDYELLFAGEAQAIEMAQKAAPCPVTVIGNIVQGEPGRVDLIDERGRLLPWPERGWDHFRQPRGARVH